MKHLKLGFASVIAILAISATIAAQAGAFEAKRTQIANCFIPTSPSFDYKATCGSALISFTTSQTSCSDAAVTGATGGHIFAGLDNSSKIADDAVIQQCPGLENVVCCVFVEADPSPCSLDVPAQPAVALNGLTADEYRIVSIKCKAQ